MPNAARVACLTARCPGFAVSRGRCPACSRSTTERGYGAAWQALSRAQRAAVPYCQACGSRRDLTADHVVNGDPSRLATLCRSCNVAKRNRERGVVAGSKSRTRSQPTIDLPEPFHAPSVPKHGGQR